jgi:hypothetical protein
MSTEFKRLTDFLVNLGVQDIDHTQKSYLAHLIGVYRLMEAEGCDTDLCRAGMFHSIYGTQQFQGFTLPLERRAEVRALIGARAERLAYLNCAMFRPTFDQTIEQNEGPYRFKDRITGEESEMSREELDDLCRVHLYDWLEQVPRSTMGFGHRRTAYRRMAERLGDRAVGAFDRVFAQEGVGV